MSARPISSTCKPPRTWRKIRTRQAIIRKKARCLDFGTLADEEICLRRPESGIAVRMKFTDSSAAGTKHTNENSMTAAVV